MFDDPFALIDRGLDLLEAEDRSGWSGPAQVGRTVGLLQRWARLEAETARSAGTVLGSGAWQTDGSRNAVASLVWHSGRSRGVVNRVVSVGRMLQAHEQTAKAVMAGELPIDHASTLARALTPERSEVYGDYEAEFLDQARRLDHRQYRLLVATWAEVIDDLLGKNNEGDRFERRGIGVGELLDGLSDLEGTLEPEGAALLRKVFAVFDIADDKTMAGGARTARQRRYDAFKAALGVALAAAARTRGHLGADDTDTEPDPGSGDTMEVHTRAAIDVIVSYEVLLGLGPATLDNLRCEIVGVGPVPPSLLRRLVAHSSIGRIIATAAGVPLDLGRQVRFFPRNHRRALRFRDGRCIWPGCDLPGEWCDADHALDYINHGRTAVTNGRFLCPRHHHLRDKGWHVDHDPANGHTSVTSPLGITWTSGPDPPGG